MPIDVRWDLAADATLTIEGALVTLRAAPGTLHVTALLAIVGTVAVTLRATLTDGPAQTSVGCYTLHQVQPAHQGTPLATMQHEGDVA